MMPADTCGHQDSVLDGASLRDRSEQVAGSDPVPDLDGGPEVPAAVAVQPGRVGASGDVQVAVGAQVLQRSLGAVEDGAEQSGPEFGVQRFAGRLDRFADLQSGGVLEDLHHHQVAVDLDDLAQELFGADPHHVEQAGVGQVGGADHRPGDLDHPSDVGGHLPGLRPGSRGADPGVLSGRGHGVPPLGVKVIW